MVIQYEPTRPASAATRYFFLSLVNAPTYVEENQMLSVNQT